jgi:hypothetical protein
MTRLSWRKRPSKKIIATLLFITALTTVFFYRQPIAIKSIGYLTKPHGLYITCLNFSLNWRLDLNLKQACITSAIGTMEVRDAIWQPWSNTLSVKQIKVKHLEQYFLDKADNTDNSIDNEPPREQQTNKLNLSNSWPKLSILSLEIDSYALLQPLILSVTPASKNELNLTGDVHASVKVHSNTLVGNIQWRLADLTKWIPRVQSLSQENSESLKELAFDESNIKTSFSFDGVLLNVNSNLDIISHIHISNCPIDITIKGHVLIDVDINSLDTSLDLSQLLSGVSLVNCSLLEDYFVEDEMPQLSFMFDQKLTINRSQINLPKLQIEDERHLHQNIVLNDVNYKTTGELGFNYNVKLKQSIHTKKITAAMFDFQAQGTLLTDLSTLASEQPFNLKIINDNNQLVIDNLKMGSLIIGNLSSQFSLYLNDTKQLELKGILNSSAIQMGMFAVAKTSSAFFLSGASLNDLQLSIDNQFFQLNHPDVRVHKITNHIDLHIKQFENLRFSGNSSLTKSSAQDINFLPIDMTHTGQVSLANMTLSSQHEIVLEHDFIVELEQQPTQIRVKVNNQEMTSLQKITSQLENTLAIKKGSLSANVELALPQEGEPFMVKGEADFQGVSAKYQNYVLNNITYQTPLIFDSAGLQLAESTLHVDSIDAGVMIEHLSTNVVAQDSVLRLKHVQGEIFNGQFLLGDLWLDGRKQQFNINIKNIDLAQVVALQQQPGIQITGNVNGDMPFIMNKQGIRIEDGFVSSLTGGKLTIIDNPSFDSIKDQQPELALLENLDFTQLKSNVKLTPDGWMFFDLALQGNNPDKKQSVDFNYSHQENLFSLLESIRLVKSVENKIEQKITQGNKK